MNLRLAIGVTIVSALISCDKGDPGPVIKTDGNSQYNVPGIFILNEGNFGRGNGSVSFYSTDSAKVYNNIFYGANMRSPGDIPFSMGISGDTGFIVVNNSGKVEVVELSDMSVITTLGGFNSPRYMVDIGGDKAYISDLHSDSLTILNTKNLTKLGVINLGRKSEMMIKMELKAYIASWSGDSVVTVVNTNDHSIGKRITVGREPQSMVLDKNGTLWILCSGGYMGEELPSLRAIDTQYDIVILHLSFPEGSYPTSLSTNITRDTLYWINSGVYRMQVDEKKLPENPLIEENNRRFYKVEAGGRKGCIFVTDARDYQRNGYLLEYSAEGLLRREMVCGVIPGFLAHMETFRNRK